MIFGTKDPCSGEWKGFGAASAEDGDAALDQLREQFEAIRKQIEETPCMDTALMSDETLMMLMMNGRIEERGKEFFYFGLTVMTSNRVPVDTIYTGTREHIMAMLCMLGDERTDEPQEEKREPKPVHCRVCGATYYSKSEAKECQRSHEWQNRRGRR